MDIICRHCNATYTVADHKLPPKRAAAKCKRCGNQIVIDPADAGNQPDPTTAPVPLPPRQTAPATQHDRSIMEAFPDIAGYAPGHYLFQMGYDEIKKVSRGLFRTSLSLTRKKGKRRIFTSMKMAFTAELQSYTKPLITQGQPMPQGHVLDENLCPSCYAGLPAGLDKCTVCHAAFKTAKSAALRSLLLPGWGDWYLGHRFLGCCELIGSLIVWSIVLGMLAEGGTENVGIALLLLAFYNGFDALLTRHMARKGYMLEARQPAAHSQPNMAVNPA